MGDKLRSYANSMLLYLKDEASEDFAFYGVLETLTLW